MSASTKPKHWPSQIAYLTQPAYSKVVLSEPYDALRQKGAGSTSTVLSSVGTSSSVHIIPIKDSSHPACGQYGLFAAKTLLPDTFIIWYLGFVHSQEETDPTSDYDLSLDRELGVGIDASKMGNEGRMINDYRGVRGQGPNAEFRDCWVDLGKGKFEKRIAVYVLSAGKSGKRAKGIAKGEEIVVSYGKGFWDGRRATENKDGEGASDY